MNFTQKSFIEVIFKFFQKKTTHTFFSFFQSVGKCEFEKLQGIIELNHTTKHSDAM